MNYVGNYLKPNASSKTPNTAFSVGGRQATALYVAGNHLVGAIDANRDNWKMIEKADQAVKLNLPLPVAPVTTDPADDSLVAKLLATVGATLPMRDAVDDRVLRQVREGTGKIIDSQNDVGGWPALAPGRAPTDSDGDGMPDAWETQHGLDPKNASDGSAIVASTGYTNLEHYLNRLVAMPGAKP
jgi:hypothetical protein